jgi:glycosyltransferase involved in cell wall biosynthesis
MELEAGGLSYLHAGAFFPEFEFQRYAARGPLRDLLARFEILQFVTGIPAWACAAGDRLSESLIWFATTARNDRASRMKAATGLRRLNYLAMTSATEACERKALRKARMNVALSDYSAGQVKALAPSERLRMIPCGVDTDAFRPERNSGGEYILCVGRHSDPRKNVALLLEAYSAAVAADPGVPDLYLVGEPPRQPVTAARVRALGLKRGEELAELYRRATMLVVPSDEEGLGIVILEAMASGVPVVSTRCGGPETAVVDGVTGLLTPVGDAGALSAAILRVAGDRSLRRRLGEGALARARDVFSITAVGGQFLDLYRGMASLG